MLLPWRGRPAMARMTTRRKAVIFAAAVLLVGGGGYGVWSLAHYVIDSSGTCMNSGVTVVTHAGQGGECVGVTDGSFPFVPTDPSLISVEDQIKKEDEQVRAEQGYVTVAYLMPAADGVSESEQTFVEQLAGAYAAQYYANHGGNVEGYSPPIQLLIASSGAGADGYKAVDADIENDVGSQHLVAVAGIATSLGNTYKEVAQDLAADQIPVFGSSPTSDLFDNVPGFVRVSPSNKQEVDALLSYIKPQPRWATAFLIQDTNKNDIYNTSIASEFLDGFPDRTHKIVANESYDTTGEVSPGDQVGQVVSNEIGQMPRDICVASPGVVLFGGRGTELATLIIDLAQRPCLAQQVTIVTGDEADDIPFNEHLTQDGPTVADGLRSGVTVYYANEFDPGEWTAATRTVLVQGKNVYSEAKQGYATFLTAINEAHLPAVAGQSDAALGYDAMYTCVSAVHLAKPDSAAGVTALGVQGELSHLQLRDTVYGASGPIALSGVYTPQGKAQGSNPIQKMIPILNLSAAGGVAFVALEQAPLVPLGG